MNEWWESQGPEMAMYLLMQATGYSVSVIDKIRRDKYPSRIDKLLKAAIAKAMNMPEERIFL